MDLAAKRVTVMGLGRFGGGVGVARFLVAQGADVLVTDIAPAQDLAESLSKLRGLPVEYRLGEHNVSDFTTADLIVANPAVKPDNRFLRAAQAANVPVTSEIRLLVERLPNRNRTIGVTGTAGKSTVAAMIAHILKKCGTSGGVWLGGNIGGSLLDSLDRIGSDDWVVLELSSFQLYHLREHDGFRGWSPHIAAVTNIAPNHLDWHGSFEAYVAAKQTVLEYQDVEQDAAILGSDLSDQLNVRVRKWCYVQSIDNLLFPVALPGKHNYANAVLAWHTADACGTDFGVAAHSLADFPGLQHRLQFVAEVNGVRCYNDSKSTTPQAAMLAIESFDSGSVHVILGGYDKGNDLTALARFAAERCAAIYTIGQTGPTIGVVASANHATPVHDCLTLDAAVARALQRAQPGHVLLLSPGCASWDQFTNYEQRGQRFVQLVATDHARG